MGGGTGGGAAEDAALFVSEAAGQGKLASALERSDSELENKRLQVQVNALSVQLGTNPAAAAALPAPPPTGGSSWRSKSEGLFDEGGGLFDETSTLPLGDLQAENRALRSKLEELTALLKSRDTELAAADDRIAALAALVPEASRVPEAGPAGDPSRAKDLLLSKLGEFGFSAFNVEHVLENIQESRPVGAADVTVNDVLDRLLTTGAEGTKGAPQGLGFGLEQSSFLGRQNSSRRNPALPSASKFGLFGDDGAAPPPTAASSAPGAAEADPQASKDSELFRNVAAVSAESKEGGGARVGAAVEGKAVPYNDFITRLMRPENADLIQHIRLFVSSVLGPNGDTTPPQKHQTNLEYQFYGTHMLPRRCGDFFEVMEKSLSTHVAWRDLGDAGLLSARNHIEKYVMTKIADYAIAGERDDAQDAALSRRMEILDFISPENLEVNPNLRNEVVWTIAQDELRKMAQFKAPGDKIACVVKCCQVIFSVLNLKRGADDTSRPGADDFLPIFIYVVLKSHVPNLYTNCEYIQSYHNPAALMSKAGYCFVNLRSAVEFILTLDSSVLSMDAAEFDAKLAAAEAAWNTAHPEANK